MPIFCSGKQGAAVYVRNVTPDYVARVEVYEPSRDLVSPPNWTIAENSNTTDRILLFEQTSIQIERRTTIPPGFATWRVYTATTVNGRVVEAYRGVHSKLHAYSFYIWKPTATSNRLTHTGAPNGSLVSWTSSTTSWISRIEFSHGDPYIQRNHLEIYSHTGFKAYEFMKDNSEYSYSVHCGCDHGNCQKGTFPLRYCCFSCSDVNRWLRQIRDEAESNKHEIQKKLGLPLTFN